MKKNIVKFFIFTFIFSWVLWLPTVLQAQWRQMPSFLLLLGMFAGFGPSITGLIMLKNEKKDDFKRYMKEHLTFSFPKKWLAVMVIFPIHGAFTLFLTKILDKDFLVINPINPVMIPIIFLQILFIGGALGEEFGWRGYALDKLQFIYGWFLGTIILGILWSVWHLPLFFMLNTVQSNLPLWQFMIQNTLLTFFYTWIYNNTKGNLVLMLLLHAILNTSAAIFPYWQSEIGRYIGVILMIAILISIKVSDSKAFEKA